MPLSPSSKTKGAFKKIRCYFYPAILFEREGKKRKEGREGESERERERDREKRVREKERTRER